MPQLASFRVPSPAPVRAGLVPPLARGFYVRCESAPALEDILEPGGAVLLASEHPGGWRAAAGKTQLAVYAARAAHWAGGLDLVAWVPAASRAAVLSGYTEAAARLGIGPGGDAEATAAMFTAWLRSAARPWLVVLDGLRDPADLEGLWPEGPSGRLLVTARDPAAAAGRVPTLAVGGFTRREAVTYLGDRLPADPLNRSGQLDLADEFGGEPAALAHAAAVIETSELACRDYLEIFRSEWDKAGGGPEAAAVTWTISVRHAEILHPGGGTWPLLVLAALLAGDGIPLAVLARSAVSRYLGGDGAVAAARALRRAGLLSVDEDGAIPAAWLSGPLRACVLAATPPELAEHAALAAADALLEAWPREQPEPALAALLRSCADGLLAAAGDMLWTGDRCHRVLLAAGQSLDAARLAGSAADWWQRVTAGSGRLLGERHQDTIAVGGRLTEALLTADRADDAVTCAEWVLAARAGTLGPDHRGTLAAKVTVGRALTAAGRAAVAVPLLDDAARLSARVYGPGDEATVTAVEEQAAACLAAGQPQSAARLLARVADAWEKAGGADDPGALAARDQLAAAFLAAGQPGDAVTQYERLVEGRERVLGPVHPGTLAARAGLARAYAAAGRVNDALRHYQRAGGAYAKALGAGHRDTLSCQAGLARAYYDAGHVGDAMSLLRTAIARAEQALPPHDPVTAGLRSVLDNIADEMRTVR
jgi:tetratricopeptide (TPR) repeat protein